MHACASGGLTRGGGTRLQGFPIMFNHLDSGAMFAAMREAHVALDVMHARGDAIALAVRARVFAYPENATACWVMVAARFRAVA